MGPEAPPSRVKPYFPFRIIRRGSVISSLHFAHGLTLIGGSNIGRGGHGSIDTWTGSTNSTTAVVI